MHWPESLLFLTNSPCSQQHIEKTISGVPIVAQRKRIQLGTMSLQVRSLASLSGCCRELWCRLKTWLGSGVCRGCGVGRRLQLWLDPEPGNLCMPRVQPYKKKAEKKRENNFSCTLFHCIHSNLRKTILMRAPTWLLKRQIFFSSFCLYVMCIVLCVPLKYLLSVWGHHPRIQLGSFPSFHYFF